MSHEANDSAPRFCIETPMARALREGVQEYVPVLEGFDFRPEDGDAANSLSNLRQLRKAGKIVTGFIAGPHGVLVEFNDGTQYLAIGFSIGETVYHDGADVPAPGVTAFAEFAAKDCNFGSVVLWRQHLLSFTADHVQRIPWDETMRAAKGAGSSGRPKIYREPSV
jgi:hypothetical protein